MKIQTNISSKPASVPPKDPAPVEVIERDRFVASRVARSIPHLTDRCSPPLSFAQERLWLLEQLEPGSPAFNRPLALHLKGNLDEAALRHALQAIVDRHEVLRTRVITRQGQPAQVISPSLTLDLRVIDLAEPDPLELTVHARRLVTEESLCPFDLAHEPPFRATLLGIGSEDHVLILVFHHMVFDAWSARVFQDELATLYRKVQAGESPALPELPIQYADFADWQRQFLGEQVLITRYKYWITRLKGIPPLDLPTDRPRPSVQTHCGGSVEIILPKSLANSLKSFGRQENATLFMVLLAAFKAMLARYTGLEDISVGSPVAGRSWVETENLIGIFINILVLRSDLTGNPTFRQLLGRVRETCRGAYSHQDFPFAKLIEALHPQRDLGTTPLFQVMFNLENLPESRSEIPGLRVEEFELERPVSDYELTLEVIPVGGSLKCCFIYNANIFDRGTVERMAGHYRTLLEGVLAEPDCKVATLPLLTSAESHQIQVEWNRTQADYPRDKTIHQLFAAQAARTPSATAFYSESGNLTYGDLNRRSNQMAHYLRSVGVGPESLVGVCLERSPEAIVALLGILKADAAYVPLDPAHPHDRLAFMLKDAQIPWVISRRESMLLADGTGARTICLDTDQRLIEAQTVDSLPTSAGPESLAYVLYTSGSSGVPKGVMGLHRGAVNRFAWMWKSFPFQPGEVSCFETSLNFVDSVWEAFGPLLQGVPSVIVSSRTVRDPAEMVRMLARHAVTRIVTVPSLLRYILDSHPDLGDRLPGLKLWVSSGEALLPGLCRRFYQALPNAILLNLYGSTEVSADVTAYVVPPALDDRGTVSLGRPIHNTRCYVLDSQFQPVPIGVRGDLYVGGDGLARGYFNRPELTAERFIPDPFCPNSDGRLYNTGDRARYFPDGHLEYLGRSDQQVKIRGYRIELKEIEAVLALHPQVASAAATIREETEENPRLVAYFVPYDVTNPPTAKSLRDFAKQKLPDYMVPADFVVLESLPLTPVGKIDRRTLPTLNRQPRAERGYIPPQDLLESQLVKIWEDILGVEPIGTEHDFFDLGGHSLLAVRMMDRIEDAYGQRLPIVTLFSGANIKHLAASLRAESLSEQRAPIVPVQTEGSQPPFYFLHGGVGLYCRKLARLIGDDQPFYAVTSRDLYDDPSLDSVEAMAEENVRQLRALQPGGPYLLGGYCHGGLIAYEMARQMVSMGLDVGPVILLDAWVPRYFGWLKRMISFGGWIARLDPDTQTRLNARGRAFLVRAMNARHHGLRPFLHSCLRVAKTDFLTISNPSKASRGTLSPPADAGSLLGDIRYRGLLMNYRPKPYSGRVVMLRTQDAQVSYPTDATAGWGKLAAQVEVQNLPGDHITCQTEHVADVAERIGKCLEAISKPCTTGWK